MHLIGRIAAVWRGNRQIRFLVIGAYNTAFGYGTFFVLYAALGGRLHYLTLSTIAHFIAVTNSYVMQRFVVFRSTGTWPLEFLRFNLSHLATLGLGLVALHVLVEYAGLSPLLAQGIVLLMIVIASYMLHSLFSFRSMTPTPGTRNTSKE